MIFHSSAELDFFNHFYKNFYSSVKFFHPYDKLSFNFVGDDSDHCNPILTDINTHDKIDIESIKNKFNASNNRSAYGYYALSRWLSIPLLDDHVCVCDIDLLMCNTIPNEFYENILNKHEVINITRKKPNGGEGGMMAMILRNDICNDVKNYSNIVLQEKQLKWDLDVDVRQFLYKEFNVFNILKMQDISKKQYQKTDDWFVFSKLDEKNKLNTTYNRIFE